MVVYARHTDPGTSEIDYPSKGVDIEYRLTNIKRSEPAADLFVLPSDYTVHWGSPSDPDMSIGPDRRPGQH